MKSQTKMPTKKFSSSFHSTKYTPLFGPENSSSSSASQKRNMISFDARSRSTLGIVLLCLSLFCLGLLSATFVLLTRTGFRINRDLIFSKESSASLVQEDYFCHLPPLLNDSELFCSATEFQMILEANPSLIVLEPDYLANVALLKRVASNLSSQDGTMVDTKNITTLEELRAQWENFRWRFSLPANFGHQKNSLTVGLLASSDHSSSAIDKTVRSLKLGKFILAEAVHGPVHHQPPTKSNSTLHLFYRREISTDLALHLHIVVLHPVEEFLWVGAIPKASLGRLGVINDQAHSETSFRLHFGLHEAEHAFDLMAPVKQMMVPLNKEAQHSITVPDDIEHYLSQVPTSRYLYCPPERGLAWFAAANRSINEKREVVSAQAFREMKALAKYLQMEVFIACGTLLGWYRQCHVTPYTSDTDFATWSKYLLPRSKGEVAQDLGPVFKEVIKSGRAGTEHLRLYQSFGEPTATMEYSFVSQGEKVDLFVLYNNGSHLLAAYHVPPRHQYGYNVYPQYRLCSGAFLGVRLLVPCAPLELILAEYGSTWKTPDDNYSYISSPRNTAGPLMHYNFTGEQHVYYE